MNVPKAKTGWTMAAVLAVTLAVGLATAWAGGASPAAHGQEGAAARPEAVPYSYAFTYQGQLKNASGPVNGACDLRFSLWDAELNGIQKGTTQPRLNETLADGLLTARLDFGAAAYDGGARWLEI